MSSTNRSEERTNHPEDYYITPIQDVKLFLQEFDKTENLDWKNMNIFDTAAGGDSLHPMSYPTAIQELFNKEINTLDIRLDSLAEIKANFLETDIKQYNPEMIVTNPPFKYAMDFVKKALNDVKDDGWVIMLLRLNFLETKARKEFFKHYMPTYIYVHHKRMSFTENGKTDSCAYAHYVWKKNNYPEFAKIKVI